MICYLYARYPSLSKTYCDSEMLALEAAGTRLVIASLNPPENTRRHERLQDLQAEVIYPPPPAVQEARMAEEDFPKLLGPLIAAHDQAYGLQHKALQRARNAWWLARELKRRGVCHIHVHFANTATHTALFLRRLGFTFSFTPQGADYQTELGNFDLLREMAAAAEFIIATSEHSLRELRELCPASSHKISRIYNGIRLSDFPGNQTKTKDDFRIVSVGRLVEFKGFHHLLSACAILRERQLPFSCEIVGEGPWRQRLEEQARDLNLGGDVTFAGALTQDKVRAKLTAANVFALPCMMDAAGASDILPTVIMEAMACALPVVSTWLVGVPEMVEEGKTGILVEPGDAQALAEALLTLAGDKDGAMAMGRAGRERVGQHFDSNKNAEILAEKFALFDQKTAAKGSASSTLTLLATFPRAHQTTNHALAAGVTSSWDGKKGAAEFDRVDFLPDGMQIEALWQQSPSWREQSDRLRNQLGAAVDGEFFFTQARRALVTAEYLRHHPHFTRLETGEAETLLWAWLTSRLAPVEVRFVPVAGQAPAKALWKKIGADFA